MKARAVHFVAPRRVELRDVELPTPAEGQLLVATEWSGISSGTELLAYRGEIDPDLPIEPLVNHVISLILGSWTTKSLGFPQPDFDSSREMIQRVMEALAPGPSDPTRTATAVAADDA